MSIKAVNQQSIEQAASIVKSGGLVAVPTETVYGLAANALNDEAVARIFTAKGRPQKNPLIVHVSSPEAAALYVDWDERSRKLAEAFWPGPLTLILKQKQACGISQRVSAGLDSLAVRCPAHPVMQDLLRASGLPIAAPSANKSGSLSPTAPLHVHHSLGSAVDLILSGGKCEVGLESTIIDARGAVPIILRPGSITPDDISQAIGVEAEIGYGDDAKPTSPGQLLKHYAPNADLRLNAVDVAADEALIAFGNIKFMGVKGGGFAKDLPAEQVINISEAGDLYEAASKLFDALYQLDQAGFKKIAVMNIPNHGLGLAINDRLTRASRK